MLFLLLSGGGDSGSAVESANEGSCDSGGVHREQGSREEVGGNKATHSGSAGSIRKSRVPAGMAFWHDAHHPAEAAHVMLAQRVMAVLLL